MYRYNGVLTAEYRDAEGLVEVVERDGVRYLHLGSPAQQSRMSLNAPDRLAAVYEQAMAGCLLFNPQPSRALLIGLGAGSMARFLLRECEHVQVEAVELRPLVVEVARRHFNLPHAERLQVSIGCGAQHVAQQHARAGRAYDLILVDAYQQDGMAPEVGSEEFLRHCRDLLSEQGVLVINLWASDKVLLSEVTRHLARLFDWRVHFIPVDGWANLIGFAFAAGFPRLELPPLELRARALQQRLQLDFPTLLQELRLSDPLGKLFIDD